MAAALPPLSLRFLRPILLDFGPNDAFYVTGFRQDWERDGRTRFHWTSQAANVRLPLLFAGEGASLRLRFRRHFVEPTTVRLTVEGRRVASFEAQADPRVAYRVVDVPLPRLEGRHPFVLSIEAPSEIDRPLGIALDWMEIVPEAATRVSLQPAALLRFASAVLIAFLLPRLAGCPIWLALGHSVLLAVLGAVGAQRNVLAFERVLREGLPAYATVGFLAIATVTFLRSRKSLGLQGESGFSGALVAIVLVAMAVRLTVLLHPQFYYPDVRVHSAFALLLARRGLFDFASGFVESQFRLSLGLQQVGAHWYAFPYPPGFYLFASPLIAWFGYRPEVATSLLAAAVNSLEPIVVFLLARVLGLSAVAALSSSALMPLLPLFLRRLSLGYFPALFGHAWDTLAIAYVAWRGRSLASPRPVFALAGLLAACFLAYTQAVLNFGVFFGLLLGFELASGRGATTRRWAAALIGSCLLAGLFAFSAFYARYVPMLEAMRDGRAVPEERILRERFEREERARAAAQEATIPEEVDPYTGPSFELLRGVRKAGWRLFVFYAAFAPLVVVGWVLLARWLSPPAARLVSAWGLSYVLLNVLSGSLPGPNLLRYNKDLELLAPLACLALGTPFSRLAEGRRPARLAAAVLAAVWVVWGASQATESLTRTFVVER